MDETEKARAGTASGTENAAETRPGTAGPDTRSQASGASSSTAHTPDQAQSRTDTVARSASDAAGRTYEQAQEYARRAGERYPQARRYLERGTQAVTNAPFMALLAAGAAGLAMAWMMGGGQSRGEERLSSRARGRRDYPGQRTGKRLIESDRVEGTAVYDRSGNRIGTIERVMLDKITGRAAYAVMSFGGFFGFGTQEFAVPWSVLDYDTSLEGYRTNLTQEQLRNAPSFSRGQGHDWSDQESERHLHDYYQVTYYWLLG